MTLHPISGKSYFLLLALLLISAFAPAQTAVPVVLAPVPQLQFFDQSGRPLSFGCVFTFQSQTTTPLATFSDFTGQYQNQNPVLLNAGGSANIWLQSGQAYSLVVKSSGGTNCALGQTIYTVDGVGGGASQLTTVVTPSGGSAAFTVQSQNQLFSLTLTGNVAGSPVSFIGVIAPALVTFQITEDGGGAHTFSWPSNVIGAAPIDTTANHSTSQTFIWNGATIMPVGLGSNTGGSLLIPPVAGLFDNSRYNQYIVESIGGCNNQTLYSLLNGGNETAGFNACIKVPAGATQRQNDAIAGMVDQLSGVGSPAVGVFGGALGDSTNARGWGTNMVFIDNGFATPNGYAGEFDYDVANAATIPHGILITGLWSAQATQGEALGIAQNNTAFHWPVGLRFFPGATNALDNGDAAIEFGATSTANNSPSQGFNMFAVPSGGGAVAVSVRTLPTGVLNIDNPANTHSVPGITLNGKSLVALGSTLAGGMQAQRFGATCTTTSTIGNTCTTTYSWASAFADANYTPVCTPVGPTQGGIFSLQSFNASGVTVELFTTTSASASYSAVDCVGVHD
jgi:hypothetical protein